MAIESNEQRQKVLYPIYVHKDEGSDYGITVPDFPGCFTAVDTLDSQALKYAVQEAIELYCEGENMALPEPSDIAELLEEDAYEGGIWMAVDVDIDELDTRPMRLNISLPRGLADKIDRYAKAHRMTRSGFLAKAARDAMRENPD